MSTISMGSAISHCLHRSGSICVHVMSCLEGTKVMARDGIFGDGADVRARERSESEGSRGLRTVGVGGFVTPSYPFIVFRNQPNPRLAQECLP